MQADATKIDSVPACALPGFVVSGHRNQHPQPQTEALVAVLAEDEKTAFAVATSDDAQFHPSGIIAESVLKEQLAILCDLRAKNPDSKGSGFVVGGFVGEVPTRQGSGMIAILAIDSDAAIVQSVEIQPDFHPTGCLSENDFKKYVEAIQRLRSSKK